ncbi:MAG: hypothetical protein H6925_03895 [Holosporaceae bacterium]|nr:MAG: hypothetical protein H6925_03895 [Holosporaceae bacterium]
MKKKRQHISPGNVLRAYPTLRGTHALHTGDAAPASDDDTGYDTLSSRGALSSQSSLAAQIGTQDTLATPFNPVPMPTVPVISPSKPDDDLLVDIRALAAQRRLYLHH